MELSRGTSGHAARGNRTLVIMAKAPRAGNVKTRLIRRLPVSAVTDFYLCLLDDTIALARSLEGTRVAIVCPGPDVEELLPLAGEGIQIVPQEGSGLAAGLASAFARFASSANQRVIAFNSDSPHLPPAVLADAFHALERCDIVVGPSDDGGYYLVGAKTSHPELFIKDVMGTTNAYEALLDRARALGLSVRVTEPFYDIDESGDFERLSVELERNPERAVKTAAWLREWNRAKSDAARHGGKK